MARNMLHIRRRNGAQHIDSKMEFENHSGEIRKAWVEVGDNEWREDGRNSSGSGSGKEFLDYISWDGKKWNAKLLGGSLIRHDLKGSPADVHDDDQLNYRHDNGEHWTMKLLP